MRAEPAPRPPALSLRGIAWSLGLSGLIWAATAGVWWLMWEWIYATSS